MGRCSPNTEDRGGAGTIDAVLKGAWWDFTGGRPPPSRGATWRGPQKHSIYGEGDDEVIRVEARADYKTLVRPNCKKSAGRWERVEI